MSLLPTSERKEKEGAIIESPEKGGQTVDQLFIPAPKEKKGGNGLLCWRRKGREGDLL